MSPGTGGEEADISIAASRGALRRKGVTEVEERRYTKTHEWAAPDGDLVTVGISEYAVEQLGDVVYVDLPSLGKQLKAGEPIGDIESVKAVSQIYAPVDGEVVEVNEELTATPEIVNNSPLQHGWIVRLRPSDRSQLGALMSDEQYRAHTVG
jgi:glycine cleavage system H protein